ncbi:MAG: Sua5/YciO/YrdC/YwlC family protein, partial [Candidatus Komeilibacteria bacterium]|nr:Sua5/YciO/YrdC/YwlC family protein [Candidatus Komeilibacteria bacterium]
MNKYLSIDSPEIITLLKGGSVGFMPTDTIYGLVASAFRSAAIERIYELKKRSVD